METEKEEIIEEEKEQASDDLNTEDLPNEETSINQIENKENAQNQTITRPMSHRVFAWIVIVLLVAMYIVTFIAAISGAGSASDLFMMSLGSTVVLPGLLYLHIRLWKHSVEKTKNSIDKR